MNKNKVIIVNIILLLWFGLDMFRVPIGQQILVSKAWQEDGIFFLIYFIIFLFFLLYEKFGRPLLTVYLSLWLITQWFSHEYFTIFGGGERKIEFFAHTIKLFESTTRYIPDLYHIILHILISLSLICIILYNRKSRINHKRSIIDIL